MPFKVVFISYVIIKTIKLVSMSNLLATVLVGCNETHYFFKSYFVLILDVSCSDLYEHML